MPYAPASIMASKSLSLIVGSSRPRARKSPVSQIGPTTSTVSSPAEFSSKPAGRIDIIDSMTVIQQHLHQLCHAFHSQAERLHVSDLGANVDADARDAQISRSGGLRI